MTAQHLQGLINEGVPAVTAVKSAVGAFGYASRDSMRKALARYGYNVYGERKDVTS